jgi:septum site-determining protein MinC
MNVRKSALFDLRLGTVDALHLTLKTADIDALQTELQQRFDVSPDFFAGEAVVLDLSRLGPDERIDIAALAAWLVARQLRPIGVVTGETPFGWEDRSLPRLESRSQTRKPAASVSSPDEAASNSHPRSAQSEEASPTPGELHAQTAPGALLVDKPLRSGQRVYAPGDLIVVEVVSHGAELIAGGNIHVYAPLRGRALAGAHGNIQARIFSTCFEPELVAIAGVYRTADQPLPASVQGKPAYVMMQGDSLRIEPLKLK